VKLKFTRREFVISAAKVMAVGLLAPTGALAVTKLASAADSSAQNSILQQWAGKEWNFVVDTAKCIGCASCVKACKKENNLPLDQEVYRTWVERYLVDTNEEVRIDSPRGGLDFQQKVLQVNKQFFVPKLCNQCKHAPCIQVCPVGATYRTGDGVVLVDRERCVGCSYCIQACPYSARFLHPVLKVADKCNWCYPRISKGLLPACVQVCPTGARKFGNIKDPASEIVALKKKSRLRVVKQDMGTGPTVFYIDLDEVVK